MHSAVCFVMKAFYKPRLLSVNTVLEFVAASLSLFGAILQSDPRDHLCHYGLGVCLSGSGKIDEAIESLQAAVKLKPNDVLSLSALAAALHASGTSERLLRAKAMYL